MPKMNLYEFFDIHRALNAEDIARIQAYERGLRVKYRAAAVGALALIIVTGVWIFFDQPEIFAWGFPVGEIATGALLLLAGGFALLTLRLSIRRNFLMEILAPQSVEDLRDVLPDLLVSPLCEHYLQEVSRQSRALLLLEVYGLKRHLLQVLQAASAADLRVQMSKHGVSLP